MTANHFGRIALAASAGFLILGEFLRFHDVYTLALVAPAIGMLAVKRSPRTIAIAGLFVAAGLYWSSRDINSCSVVWRAKFVVDKALGRVEPATWGQVLKAAFTNVQCPVDFGEYGDIREQIREIANDTMGGHELVQYSTPMGDFWLADTSGETVSWLVWEIGTYEVYRGRETRIQAGDTVIDAGAHVGVFTRYALDHGAARVVAIEPNPVNLECLKRNFAQEIEGRRVIVVPEGVWEEASSLELSLHAHDTSRPTLLNLPGGRADFLVVPVRPLDDIVVELGLDRVDFIKMDIEGAEREALRGARETIGRFRPRMAICTYHRAGDPIEIPKAARAAIPDYRVRTKGFQINDMLTHPKVMFFN